MKNYKHLIAGAMAAVMVLSSSVVALADSGSTTGQGSLDIVSESDVFKVELPVNVEGVFDYILDPTGVIDATNADKYAGATFEDGQTLYFASTVSGGDDYSHVSDTLTATNKSTMDVEISVTASVTEVAGVTMVADAAAASVSGGDAKLYLGLYDDANNQAGLAIDTEGVEAKADIAAADGAYEIVYEDGAYKKQLKEDTVFNTYNFHLEGACSTDGWDGLTENPPAVEVVWTIENPTGPTRSYAKDIVLGGPGEMATADVVIVDDAQLISVTTDVLEGNLLTVSGTWAAFYNKDTHTLYFYTGLSDYLRTNPSITFTLTFKPADGENYTVTLKCAN